MANLSCWEKCCDRLGVGCCIDEDEFKQRPLAEVVQNKDRHCTDVPCLIVLLVVFFLEFYLIIYASGKGADPDYLLHGWEYTGELCSSDNADGKYNAWPALNVSYEARICVTDCSETSKDANNAQMVVPYTSEAFLDAYCIPTAASIANISNSVWSFDSAEETYERAVSDLNTAKWLILISSFIAIFMAFGYLKLVSCIARVVIWVTIILLFAGGFLMSYYLIKSGEESMKDDETEETGKWELGIGISMAIILCLMMLSMLWCRKRIALAIEMLHEAGHAIRDMKSTIIFPIVYSLVGMAYIAFWIAVALYIYSVKIEESAEVPSVLSSAFNGATEYYYYQFDTSMKNTLIFHFVCLFYIMQVIIYFGFMVLGGVIADWYFSSWEYGKHVKIRGEGPAQLSHKPMMESLWRVFRYHIGSLAFGAAVITIIRIIRAIVTYIELKTKEAQNPLSKCLFACAQCCLKCFQCILDKISKEGFIFTTIYGTAFCYSSFQALKLLFTNIGRATVVHGISRYMEIFGRLAIAFLTTGICLAVMNYNSYYVENLSSSMFPCIVIFVLSYLIGSLFMMVFEVGVDTIFLCFLVDETVHGRPKFASEKLMDMTALRYDIDSNGNVQTDVNGKPVSHYEAPSAHGGHGGHTRKASTGPRV